MECWGREGMCHALGHRSLFWFFPFCDVSIMEGVTIG